MLPRRLAAAHWSNLAVNEELGSTAAPSPLGKGALRAGLDSALTNGVEPYTRYRISCTFASTHSALPVVPTAVGCRRPLRRCPLRAPSSRAPPVLPSSVVLEVSW
ncbi:Os05g0375044 [Oryza sativa Japonica Group]|uniref:Os05g0375044 protein n=1 Tax=Oryza sativa subsp. japonica TaxID=39947 RepID=A0A0P0WLN9_ORYSJ|nr:Os05g0375044 [Oryza sativa Japonica Group]